MKTVTGEVKGSPEGNPDEIRPIRNMVVSGLRELGLSSYAARSLVVILEHQPISAGGICGIEGIPDSKIYYALKELEDRRLVMVQHGTPSMYMVSNASGLLHGLETHAQADYSRKMEKLHETERAMETLKDGKKLKAGSTVELAFIVKGLRGITNRMKESVEQARRDIVFLVSDERLMRSLIEPLRDARDKRGLDVRIAASEELRKSSEFSDWHDSSKRLMCNCNVIITDASRIVTAETGDDENEYAIVTRNQSMIALMMKSLEAPGCCM